MKNFLLSILLIFMTTACNPSQAKLATAVSQTGTSLAALVTATLTPTLSPTAMPSPTVTVTPTLMPTPTSTNTPTPTPTPIGGGVLRIAFIGKDDQENYALYIGNLNTSEFSSIEPISYEQDPSSDFLGPVNRWGGISLGWSPDGRQLVFNTGASQNDRLKLLDVSKGEVTELQELPNGSWIDRIAWPPNNGSLVAYQQAIIRGHNINPSQWVVDVSNDNIVEVADYQDYYGLLGWSPDGNALYYRDGSWEPIRYDPINQTQTRLTPPPGRRQVQFPLVYIPEIDAFLDTYNTKDANCPTQYDLYLNGSTSPQTICDVNLDYHFPATISTSPDGNWLFWRGNTYQHDSAYLLDLNTLTLRNLGDSIIWLLGWTPDQSGFIAVMFAEGGRDLFEPLYLGEDSQFESQMDSQIASIIQIAFIDAATGNLKHIYPFPSAVQPMIKLYNFHSDDGIGLSIHCQTQP
jgi:hypothetical protein